jgi:hypothetical protein
VEPYRAQIKTRSDNRVATNQDFLYVQQDIEQYVKMQVEKTVSLNENTSIKERERVALQNKARDKERAARSPYAAKFYELSIAAATEPGLPPPLKDAVLIATNTVATTTNAVDQVDTQANQKPEVKKPAPGSDPVLEEAQQILTDYIAVLAKSEKVVAK